MHIACSLRYWMLHQIIISSWYKRSTRTNQCVSNEDVTTPKSPVANSLLLRLILTTKYPFYVLSRMIINMLKLILHLMICDMTILNIYNNNTIMTHLGKPRVLCIIMWFTKTWMLHYNGRSGCDHVI